jgi:hypothetical protein
MRYKTLLSTLAVLAAGTAAADYEEVRELKIDTRGIDLLNIDAGAGSLEVVGVSGSTEIVVTARISVPGTSDARARDKIESDMVLTLDKDSDTARLKSYFDSDGWGFGGSPTISLDVRMPESMHLVIDDGSGSIDISNVRGDISVDDGSGSLSMQDVGGNVAVEDGSGTITISGVGGDLEIDDGSGTITVRHVAGSVVIDDGSGSIDVTDVAEDLIIVDDGSGGFDYANIGGRVQTRD